MSRCLLITTALAFALGTATPGLAKQDRQFTSTCAPAISKLADRYHKEPRTRKAFDAVHANLKAMPAGYAYDASTGTQNPWSVGTANGRDLFEKITAMFDQWCEILPEISGNTDNALDPILYFAWFFYQNTQGQDLVQGRDPNKPSEKLQTVQEFLQSWGAYYKTYMDSAASSAKVKEWMDDPRIEIDDYLVPKDGFKSWNRFFARQIDIATRPVTMPDRDYVIVAPADCIMNPLIQVIQAEATYQRRFIENPLQYDTVLDVKGIPLSVEQLLADTPKALKEKFVGGTGLSCVLMPNTYHHFHAPVDGVIKHAEIVETGTPFATGTFGYIDYPNWVPGDGDVGRLGTDFSQFQTFQRGIVIIEVSYANLPGHTPSMLTGYVASIPVGLDSVGSVVFDDDIAKGTRVVKGVTRLGNFYFGGSLNILLFSKGLVGNEIQTRMGNQIALINVGKTPKSPWSLMPFSPPQQK